MPSTVTAYVILKGHSERVPGKNFRSLGGRPLYRWVLDTLLSVAAIERVVLDTDVADRLRDAGLPEDPRLTLRRRPLRLCGDDVTANTLIAGALEDGALDSDTLMMTHPTNPFLSAGTLRAALATFRRVRADRSGDSVFTVTRHQTRFYREDGSPVNHDSTKLLPTQALEPWFEENSNLYLFDAESFEASGSRVGLRPVLYETPQRESLDIDTPGDWAMAEVIAAQLGAESAQ